MLTLQFTKYCIDTHHHHITSFKLCWWLVTVHLSHAVHLQIAKHVVRVFPYLLMISPFRTEQKWIIERRNWQIDKSVQSSYARSESVTRRELTWECRHLHCSRDLDTQPEAHSELPWHKWIKWLWWKDAWWSMMLAKNFTLKEDIS